MAEKIKKSPEQALSRLMDLCAKSEKCTFDARQSLYRWGVDTQQHDRIIDTLVKDKFIDNSRYAMAYVREKSNLNRWGAHKITAMLRAKGIDREIISEALMQIDSNRSIELLEEHLKRKLRTVKYKNEYDLRGKLLRYGTSQGFDYSDVCDAIDRLKIQT